MASMNTKRASSSSSSTHRLTYEVFLSFRGEDTRNGFTSHLYTALDQKGICTFIDDEKLERGKSISPALMKAIKESRFAIVILSKNYASSTWCLEELEEIIGCIAKTGMTVLPIFYNVDPSDVRKQTGTFKQAFDEHEQRFKENIEKVQKWRTILKEVANTSGWHLPKSTETKVIQEIVQEIVNKLSSTYTVDTKGLIGINYRSEELKLLLDLESNSVRIIGIWGMGGMGKTTLARVVYGMISNQFEAHSFIANVGEDSKNKGGLLCLQQNFLKELMMGNDMYIPDVDSGILMIKKWLRYKKILLVLDDVNKLDQLNKLAGENDWFGPGSRIIITTRDEHLLRTRKVDVIYETKGLNDVEAFHLFNLKAFGEEHPITDYLELSDAFIHYASGLPLAIEILGSFLFSKSKDEWESALNRLKEYPDRDILNVLQISYDGLQETEKEIFLNISCFCNHEKQETVIDILDSLELYPKIGLRVLIDKSLIKLQENRLWMHDLLQDMGHYIVRQECREDPGKRSRLWLYKDIDGVLTKNTGTKIVQGMVIKLHEPKKTYWNPESFSKVHDLKLLIVDNVHLLHEPKHLPNDLRFLDWSGFPSKYFPSSFQQKNLRLLPKPPLNISYIWGYGCTSLETVPDLLKLNNLGGSAILLSNCSKLADKSLIDMFFAVIRKHLQGHFFQNRFDIVIPGSEIPEWFRHQSIGNEVSIQEPYSLLCNEWMGIAVCVVFCTIPRHQNYKNSKLSCYLIANGKKINSAPNIGEIVALSDHIWLLYLLPQFYKSVDIKSMWECDANGFSQIGVIIENRWSGWCFEVKKCGLRLVYKKDIEDLNRTMTQRHHNFDNSMAAAEGYKAKRTRDDYVEARSSNDEPHPKRIGNSNWEESSEYKDCREELSESDLEG